MIRQMERRDDEDCLIETASEGFGLDLVSMEEKTVGLEQATADTALRNTEAAERSRHHRGSNKPYAQVE